MIRFSSRASFRFPAALVLMTEEQAGTNKFKAPSADVSSAVTKALVQGHFSGGKGELFPVLVDDRLVVLLGLGKEKELSLTSLRVFLRRALLSAYFKKVADIELVPHQDSAEVVMAIIDAKMIGMYAWRKYVARKKDDKTVEKKTVHVIAAPNAAYADAVTVNEAVNFTRDLINENADVTTAEFLEATARSLVRGKAGVGIEVLDRRKLKQKKFGLLLAVNKGSAHEPRVVVVTYKGGKTNDPYIAFVGKGLTFDSGGLNLKPSGSMETMRSDMSGAAAVLGTLKAAIALKLKKNVIFAFGAVENAIDANSYKPGDVFVGYAGKSVEIGNTDAEGRLVLADVISYVIDVHNPSCLVDLATLTGACVVGLGNDYAGLMSNNEDLAARVAASAALTDDRAWRLPLYPELKDMIKSKIADIRNISNQRGSAGAMTAAEFLQSFVGKTPWAHLDIAGPSFVEGDSRMYYGHGATGYGVRLCVDLIKKS